MSTNNSQHTGSRKYWKSLEELVPTRSVGEQARVNTEFPEGYDRPPVESSSGVSRRTFMGLLSASMAVAATSCRRPDHKFVPAVRGVEYQIPGLPNFYTTVFSHGNAASGLLIKTREGRPVKIEGNDMHPASMGASSAYQQATLLALYDPDRMKGARVNNGYSSIDNAVSFIAKGISEAQAAGKGTRILLGEHASPSLAALIQEIQAAMPSVQFVVLPAISAHNAAAANNAVLGVNAEFVPNYAKADVIVSVDCDFLSPVAKHAEYNVRQFTLNRRPTIAKPEMNKLVVAESTLSLTGSNADVRVRLTPDQYEGFLGALAQELGAGVSARSTVSGELAAQAKRIAADIKGGQQGVIVVGAHLPMPIHALALAINQAIGAIGAGRPLDPGQMLPFSADNRTAVEALRSDLKSGAVGAVIFADTNPMYWADKDLQQQLEKVSRRYAISMYDDETVSLCSVYIPRAHYLETWGDAISFDGTLSIQQPLVAPLNESSLSLGDAFLRIAKASGLFADTETFLAYVQRQWGFTGEGYKAVVGATAPAAAPAEGDSTAAPAVVSSGSTTWEKVLRDGVFRRATSAPTAAFNAAEAARLAGEGAKLAAPGGGKVHCLVTPSYAVYDGYIANNGWLQELADPVTKVTWGNVAMMNAATAKQLGVEYGDMVKISTEHGSIIVPTWIQPGMVNGVVATTVGYGRKKGGVVLEGVGDNAYTLFGPGESIGYTVASIEKTGEHEKLATTQNHHTLMGRNIVQETTFSRIKGGSKELFARVSIPGKEKGTTGNRANPPENIMDEFVYKGHRWAMSIDLSACTGCNACVIACQSENNIPVVGKEQVINGREMQWLRIDRYFVGEGDLETIDDNVQVVFQPMLCQHCENAPCENVCPVAATTHSPEGLNEMTYNRCVGTRYCLNNCPYKVRRFNYLNWHKKDRTPIEFVFNPDVTVRMRGVIEKCTFCVQRINEGKYRAKDAGRARVNDGEVVTACQQACPADAIVFGDVNDEKSKIHSMSVAERGYLVLEEINTRPQVTYQAKVRNDKSANA